MILADWSDALPELGLPGIGLRAMCEDDAAKVQGAPRDFWMYARTWPSPDAGAECG